MQAKELIGYGLVAVAGYWILEQMGLVPCHFMCSTPTLATPAGQTVASSGAQTATTNNVTGVVSQSTVNAIKSKMQSAADDPTESHTVYQWNYYYQQARGVPGPDPNLLFPNNSNATTELFTFNEWWTAMGTAGFSGLGVIAPRVHQNGYSYHNQNSGVGSRNHLSLTASEQLIKRMN